MGEDLTIKHFSENFVGGSIRNITELPQISTDLIVRADTGKDIANNDFSYYYVEVNGVKYRMPKTVFKDLKEILKKKPSLKTFAVSKTGEGKNTKYTVIPIE